MPLNPGDIAFVGFNADGNDNIAFVALADIAIGEIIIFEDNEWNGSGWVDTNESAFSWTASSAVSAGTIVFIDNITSGTPLTASTGTVQSVAGRGSNRGLANSGESLYVYQGNATSPTFITAVSNNGFANQATGVLTGTGLTAGVNALALTGDRDIGAYTGARGGEASFASYRSLINDPTNWQTQDGTGDQSIDGTPPDVPFSATAFTIAASAPNIQITEYMYDGGNGEFVEFTNLGTAAVDMTGWSYDDDSRIAGTVSLSAFGVVQPGESVILAEAEAAAFRAAWSLPDSVKVIGGLTTNLGRADEINLFDTNGQLADRLTYGDQVFAGTIRTQTRSGWAPVNQLADQTIDPDWVLSTANDNQNSRSSTGNDTGNPGVYNTGAPGVVLIQSGGTTNVTEGGTTDTYTIVLRSQPSATVTININTGSQILNVPAVVFTTANWNVPQTVTVTANDDAVAEGNHTGLITHTAVSSDSNYNGISIGSVTPTITDNDTATSQPPSIQEATATPFLNLTATGSGAASGVINDPTDPARILGIDFTIADADTPVGNLIVSATSNNQAVVANGSLNLTGTGTTRNLKITPSGVGLADITVTVSDGVSTASYVINYAASAASVTPATTRFHTGTSDASTAIAIDANYMLVADDEDQTIRLYDRNASGLPLNAFDFTSALGLSGSSEVDIEGSTRIGNTIYWTGSHSNNSSGNNRDNRERIFSTTLAGSGAATTLTFGDYYSFLEDDLVAWDNANGHGLGAGALGLGASAADGVLPEQTNGFNIEGLTIAPDGTTAYVSFRAPLEPTASRTNALIVPVQNFASLINDGNVGSRAAGSASFGAPIFLNLGGRGIRSIERNDSGQFVIVAGTATAGNDFKLYTWTGNPADAPIERSTDLTALLANGSFESIVEVPTTLTSGSQIQLLVDNGDSVWYNNGVSSKDLEAPTFSKNLQKFRSEVVTLGTAPLRIRDIQGAAHISPLLSSATDRVAVSNIAGIVTAKASNGFYIQDPTPDTNAATSEGIFVFTGTSAAGLAILNARTVGEAVLVTGTVSEFRPGNNVDNLTTTQISSTTTQALSVAAWTTAPTTVITPTVLNPPTQIINNDAVGGNVETAATPFDPAQDGIDYYESVEGMLVTVPNSIATSPTNRFGEIWVLANDGAGATSTTARGGSLITATDFNPERIQIDDDLIGGSAPDVNVGAKLGDITGVVSYNFNNFEVLATSALTVEANSPLQREVTTLDSTNPNQLTVATFNVENLSLQDASTKFTALAQAIVTNLRSPDIINLEEIQDNNGPTNDSVVDASVTFQTLINAIAAAGGPTYEYRQINPVDDQDGGQPGGNIRVGFLFNPNRVQFVDRPGGGSTTNTTVTTIGGVPQLSSSPGRIVDTTPGEADTYAGDDFASSRKPLVGEFLFNGQTVFVVGNHFNSKGGDDPLFGPTQAPVLSSEAQRIQQATLVRDFVRSILAINPNANVVVAGDLNDFEFSAPLTILEDGGALNTLIETLPANERYTYNFQGNAQTLDHILASSSLLSQLDGFDVVHINAEFADQISDHDPVIARFNLAQRVVSGTAGSDTLIGSMEGDRLVGVNLASTTPGRNEIDSFTGGGGPDRFVLGDAARVYYDDVSRRSSGTGDYGRITDFNLAQGDVIQLKGAASDYSLGTSPVAGVSGTGIFLRAGQTTPELIGVIQGITVSSFNAGFVFV